MNVCMPVQEKRGYFDEPARSSVLPVYAKGNL